MTVILSFSETFALIWVRHRLPNLDEPVQSICVKCLRSAASAKHLRFDFIQAPNMASERPCVSAR